MKNYVSKFDTRVRSPVDSYHEDDSDDSEHFMGNIESRDENKKLGKLLGRDVLRNYVFKNTFRSNSKKYVEDDSREDDEDDSGDDDDDDDSWEDDEDDSWDEDDEDNDDDDEDTDNDDDGDSNSLDLLIIDGFPYQLSKYSPFIKLKEVLIGNQCKYINL